MRLKCIRVLSLSAAKDSVWCISLISFCERLCYSFQFEAYKSFFVFYFSWWILTKIKRFTKMLTKISRFVGNLKIIFNIFALTEKFIITKTFQIWKNTNPAWTSDSLIFMSCCLMFLDKPLLLWYDLLKLVASTLRFYVPRFRQWYLYLFTSPRRQI